MKRDVLTRLDGLTRRDGSSLKRGGSTEGRRKIEVLIEPNTDEPTWEVRQPHTGRSGTRRFNGRARLILTAAAATAVIVNAGAVWAYWRITESTTGRSAAGMAVELALRGRSDLNKPLTSGATGNLTVTLTNDHDFPVRITSVSRGAGNVVADDEHRDAGCTAPVVNLTEESFAVQWDVQNNMIGAFTIPNGLIMAAGGDPACEGATFTVPVQVRGVGRAK